MEDQGSDYVLKYAGGISIYYKKKKIGLISMDVNAKGEWIHLQASKHPKYNSAPLILSKSNIEFDHRRRVKELNQETKDYKGAWGFVDFMEANFNPKNISLNDEVIKFLIDESSEVRSNPEIFKDLISEKFIQQKVEAFKSKRRDSKDFIESIEFLKKYFDDDSKVKIDI